METDRRICVTWWLIGRFDDCRGFESRSSHHIGTSVPWVSPSLVIAYCSSARNSDTVSLLCRERLCVVVELKKRYRSSLNERMNISKSRFEPETVSRKPSHLPVGHCADGP